MKSKAVTAAVILALACAGTLLLTGCDIAGFAAQAAFPEVTKAQYTPPKTPMLVLVENRQNPTMGIAESDELGAYIIDDLKTYEVCPIIEPKVFQQFCDEHPDWNKMSISELGKGVGAAQVLYVDIQRVGFGQITGVPASGRIDVAVHVVDVKTRKTVFPSAITDSFPLSSETPLMTGHEADLAAAQHDLIQTMGTRIGRLFHEYKPNG
jgi:hypothetical protein